GVQTCALPISVGDASDYVLINQRGRSLSMKAMTVGCLSLAFTIPALADAADGSTLVAAADIDNAVIREHVSHEGKQATLVSHSDLTKAFDAVSQWTLVVAQETLTPSPDSTDDGGPLVVCL